MSDKGNFTPSQMRGDIQAGKTGDIRPGFDPAVVPMETDAEAAGTPLTNDQVEMDRNARMTVQQAPQKNYDVAMREPVTNLTESQTQGAGVLKFLAPILIASAIAVAVLSWLFMK